MRTPGLPGRSGSGLPAVIAFTRTLSACLVAAVGALASPALHAETISRAVTRGWFDAGAAVTAKGQREAADAGLPPLLSGVPIWRPEISPLRSRYSNEDPGCATVQFQVTPAGTTDHFMVLESRPNQAYGAETIKALSLWKFAPPERANVAVLTVDFSDRGAGGVSGGSLIKKEHSCFGPTVRVGQLSAADRQVLASPLPYFPPSLVAERETACVEIAFAVRPDGLADDYRLVSTAVDQGFVKATLQALNQWRFAARDEVSPARVQILFDAEKASAAPACPGPVGAEPIE